MLIQKVFSIKRCIRQAVAYVAQNEVVRKVNAYL